MPVAGFIQDMITSLMLRWRRGQPAWYSVLEIPRLGIVATSRFRLLSVSKGSRRKPVSGMDNPRFQGTPKRVRLKRPARPSRTQGVPHNIARWSVENPR